MQRAICIALLVKLYMQELEASTLLQSCHDFATSQVCYVRKKASVHILWRIEIK